MKPTLKSLLAWAKRNCHTVIQEMGGNGTVLKYGSSGDEARGETLYQALRKAKEQWK